MIRVLRLEGDAVARGHAHGETYRDAIRAYTEERVGLACNGTWAGRPIARDDVLALAAAMIPAHEAYDLDLTREMAAMADAAGLSLPEAIIVGGFTDFVDAVRARGGTAEEDDCTAALVPDARADGRGWLAQTWDMHATATEHVILLDVRPDDGPRALVFTTVGCVGQIGLNAHGVAVGINNLTTWGGIGVTWPHVVRQALRARAADEAVAAITNHRLAGGHNYLVMDAWGVGVNVEATRRGSVRTPLADVPLVHTNHALDPAIVAVEAPRHPESVQSSLDRLAIGRAMLDAPAIDLDLLMRFTREPGAICRHPSPPLHMETSGAVIMRPRTRELWAVWGNPGEHAYERFVVD